jgi:MFS family permease
MAANFSVGWRQVAACFLLLAASGMVVATYSVIAVPLAREFQPSRMTLMLAMTVHAGTSALLAPFIGTLMDRMPLRPLMALGSVLLSAGYVAISFATSFPMVLLSFAVFFAPGCVLIGPVAITVLLSRWFEARRGRAIGIAIAGISAGGFLFPIIIQNLLDAFAWREALRFLALVLLLWTFPVTLLVVSRPEDRGLHPDGRPNTRTSDASDDSITPVSVSRILTDPSLWLIALTVAIVTAGMKGMITNLAPLALDAGIDATIAAYLISIYSACSFTAKLSFAALSDRFGPRPLMALALAGVAVGMAALTQAAAGYWLIAAAVGCIGLFGGLMVPMESYLAPRVFGKRAVGRAMGILSGVILVAMLATPPLFGLIYDVTGAYTGIFWTFAGLAAIAIGWVRLIRLHPRDPAVQAGRTTTARPADSEPFTV